MKLLLIITLLFNLTFVGETQNSFSALVLDRDSKLPLTGAAGILEGTSVGGIADHDGVIIFRGIPDGSHTIIFSFVGYEEIERTFTFPFSGEQPVEILLEGGHELEEVIVSTTRRSRTIENIPTRLEAITAEELGEKAVMNSSNIAMILRESTGIMVQQTSANSGNQSLRIQGLDGRYTQLLKDGFPLFSGFAGGLSIMQVPPLDLQQVEVIKGSASTLYGGGAIAGLVNLVTKRPEADAPELNVMFNQTTAGGSTANAFWSQRFGKTGVTLYASGNLQNPYDPNDDNFSDIPDVESVSINPRFFWYPTDRTNLWFGISTAFEKRTGGDMEVLRGRTGPNHIFSEDNRSDRIATQLHVDHTFESGGVLSFRNSLNWFDRTIEIPDYVFQGRQTGSFSELTWSKENDEVDWIFGANLFTDDFEESLVVSGSDSRDYNYSTIGAFTQNTWALSDAVILETGLRLDHNEDFGTFFLPRISLLLKSGEHLAARIGGGLGYKLPTIFTEEAEILSFAGIKPIDVGKMEEERSIGANFDINYKTVIGDHLTFSINQLFFYTKLSDALVLEQAAGSPEFSFANATGPVETMGFETNVRLTYHDFKLFLQYAYADVQLHYHQIDRQKPLTPKHSAGAVLMFEQHGKWRIGYELYYTGPQFRSDFSKTRDYWIMGLMALREFERFSLFINFENFIDTRQSRYQSMVEPPHTNPTFTEIWAPTDGFVANGGFILKLFGSHDHH